MSRVSPEPVSAARRLRVAQVVTRMDVGGVPDHIMTLVRGVRNSADITVVCNAIDERHRDELEALGVRIRIVPMRRLLAPVADVRGLVALTRLFRTDRYDIVHTHMSKAALLGGIAATLARVPVRINTAHNIGALAMPNAALRALFWIYDRLLLGLTTDAVVTVAERVKAGIAAKRIVPEHKLFAIHNGIDTQRFSVSPDAAQAVRREFGLADDDVLVVAVARLVWFKGLDTLVAAAAIVLGSQPQARFLIVGDGPQRDQLMRQAEALDIASRVTFAGERRDIPAILAAADLFVLSSVSEGLPVSILEAMASAKPVVATRVGGVAELVEDGSTGLLVDAGNASGLATALGGLIADPNRRMTMGRAGLARVKERFSNDRMVAKTAALYRDLLAAGSRDRASVAPEATDGV